MAKKTKAAVIGLSAWDDVNNALKQIAECQIGIEAVEADMNVKIQDAKTAAERLARPLKTTIEILETQIKAFADTNKDGLDGKTKNLTFGRVWFRQSSSISYPTAKTADILAALEKYGFADCIRIEKKVDKEALEKRTDKDIERVGAKRKIADNFNYEAYREEIK